MMVTGQSRLLRVLIAFAPALQVACGATDGTKDSVRRGSSHKASVGGGVVSTVNGEPITVAAVQTLIAGSALTPTEALRRLQAERLLMIEADRSDVSQRHEVQEVSRQALVQALLEDEAESVTITDQEVAALYEKHKQRFEKAERRASVHVLARLPKDASPSADAAAKAFAQNMIAQLALSSDLDALLQANQGQKGEGFEVHAERLPAVDRQAAYERPYQDAVFSLSVPGVAPLPVRTSYGWHAIRVTEIIPLEQVMSESAALETLRKEGLTRRRRKRVEELVAQLRREYPVVMDAKVSQVLAALPP